MAQHVATHPALLYFAKRLDVVLNERGRGSRKQLADALDVSSKTVNNWTRAIGLSGQRCDEIADYLGMTPDEMFGPHEPPPAATPAIDPDAPDKRGPAGLAELSRELSTLRARVSELESWREAEEAASSFGRGAGG